MRESYKEGKRSRREGGGEARWLRGVDGFLICVSVREERQEENKGERERGRGGPVVKANRAPGKTHTGSLLTPIQEKGSKSAQRERRNTGNSVEDGKARRRSSSESR